MAPSTLIATSSTKVLTKMPAATIQDHAAMSNIPPFGMCTSMSNPSVASATAAALGVLTPMPCAPVTPAPWAPGSPAVRFSGYPALNNTSQLSCAYGGVINIVKPGQDTVLIP
jgi:hypothetical protein